jgi:hypothetical protein
MTNAADALGIDLGQRHQHVNRADVVPDALHRAAGIAVPSVEVVLVLAKRGKVRRQGDKPPLGQFQGVLQLWITRHAGWFVLAVRGRLMQAQHGGQRIAIRGRQEQPGRHHIVRLGAKRDLAARDLAHE